MFRTLIFSFLVCIGAFELQAMEQVQWRRTAATSIERSRSSSEPALREQINFLALFCCVMPMLVGTIGTIIPLRELPLLEKNFFEYSQPDYEKILRASLFVSCAVYHAKIAWALRTYPCCQFLLALPLLAVYLIPLLVALLPDDLSVDYWRNFCVMSLAFLPYSLLLGEIMKRINHS